MDFHRGDPFRDPWRTCKCATCRLIFREYGKVEGDPFRPLTEAEQAQYQVNQARQQAIEARRRALAMPVEPAPGPKAIIPSWVKPGPYAAEIFRGLGRERWRKPKRIAHRSRDYGPEGVRVASSACPEWADAGPLGALTAIWPFEPLPKMRRMMSHGA